jgi:hypothetical protein
MSFIDVAAIPSGFFDTGLVPTGLGIAATAFEALEPIILRSRLIGPFQANVTIEERHVDELSVSEHPVEQGAAISDHSFKRPASVIIRAGWSNSSRQANNDPNYVIEIYEGFLALQASRIPFEILTGKRAYLNMLITRLTAVTDKDNENALMMICECREILIATTQLVTVGNPANMASPQLNAASFGQGNVSLQPGTAFNFEFPG